MNDPILSHTTTLPQITLLKPLPVLDTYPNLHGSHRGTF